MAQEDSDLQKIKELIEIMKDNELVEVEIKHGDDKIFLKRSQPSIGMPMVAPNIPAAPAGPDLSQTSATEAIPSAAQPESGLVEIKSLMVGTFYAAPSPDSDPYLELGSHVSSQTVICIVEAMKVIEGAAGQDRPEAEP